MPVLSSLGPPLYLITGGGLPCSAPATLAVNCGVRARVTVRVLQCWESAVGEELFRLTTFNFLLTVAFTYLVTLPRR